MMAPSNAFTLDLYLSRLVLNLSTTYQVSLQLMGMMGGPYIPPHPAAHHTDLQGPLGGQPVLMTTVVSINLLMHHRQWGGSLLIWVFYASRAK